MLANAQNQESSYLLTVQNTKKMFTYALAS